MLRDQIVWGIQDQKLQLRLIEKNDLTYERAVEMARQSESTKEQVSTMNTGKSPCIDEIRHTQHRNTRNHVVNGQYSRNNNKHRDNRNRNTSSRNGNRSSSRNNNNSSSSNKNASHTQHQQREKRQHNNENEKRCKFCNYTHKFGTQNCPAYDKSCNICSKNNHFSSVCRQRNVSALSVDNDYDYNDNDEFLVSTLHEEKTTDDVQYPWIEHIAVDKTNVPFKIDTGAGVDVLSLKLLKQILKFPKLNRTEMTLHAFAGEKVKPLGTYTLICNFRGHSMKIKFTIVDFDCTPILDLRSCV